MAVAAEVAAQQKLMASATSCGSASQGHTNYTDVGIVGVNSKGQLRFHITGPKNKK